MTDRRTRLAPTFERYAAEACSRAGVLVERMAAAEVDLGAVILQAHTMAGSGATMGADAISCKARRMEHLAVDLRNAGRQPDPAERAELTALAAELLQLAETFDPEPMLDAFIAKMFPNG
jgi:HPt (histidine-containing phosphotransfer) domain-containing protein